MRSPTTDRVQCALLIQRLMDADLLLPDEGNALLAEIKAWNPPANSPDAWRICADLFLQALEAITQIDRLDAVARQAVLETAHAHLRQPADSTAPEAQSRNPRE